MGGIFSPKNQKSTSTYKPPQYISNAAQQVIGSAGGIAANANAGPTFNPLENTAYGTLGNVNTIAQPYIGQAYNMGLAGANPFTPTAFSSDQINQYMSPYNDNVVNATMNQLGLLNAQQQNQVVGNAASNRALGGDRVGVAQAQLAGQQAANEAPTIAGLYNQNYTQALNEFNTQQQTGLAAAQANAYRQLYGAGEIGNLGQEALGTTLSGTGAQLQAGQQQQAQPYFNDQMLASLIQGVAPSQGGTTTATQPGPSLFGQLLGLGTTAAGLGAFSSNSSLPLGGTFFGAKRGGGIKAFAEGGYPDEDMYDSGEYMEGDGGYAGLGAAPPMLPPPAGPSGNPALTAANGISRTNIPAPTHPAMSADGTGFGGAFGLDPSHEALVEMGLGMMASRNPFPLGQVGEGALSGLKAYQQQRMMQMQQAYRSSMAQAAMTRAEALAHHYGNMDNKPVLKSINGTYQWEYPNELDDNGMPVLRDTHIPDRGQQLAAGRLGIEQGRLGLEASGEWSIHDDPATGEQFMFNNRTHQKVPMGGGGGPKLPWIAPVAEPSIVPGSKPSSGGTGPWTKFTPTPTISLKPWDANGSNP